MSSATMETSTTVIDLLRHGECEDGHCYRGSTDVALSEIGRQTMSRSINLLVKTEPASEQPILPWQAIISSPLQRCYHFAHDLSQRYQLPLHSYKAFKEMHFGDWEGQSIDHIWQTQPANVERWFADPVNCPPPNGERADTFNQRISQALLELVQVHQGQHLLLVTHGGVIRSLLSQCLSPASSTSITAMHSFDVPYGCLSRIAITTTKQTETQSEDNVFYRVLAHNAHEMIS